MNSNLSVEIQRELHFLLFDLMQDHYVSSIRHNQQTLYDVDDVALDLGGTGPNNFRESIPDSKLVTIDGTEYIDGRTIISILRLSDTKKSRAFVDRYEAGLEQIKNKHDLDSTVTDIEPIDISDADLYPVITFEPHEKLTRRNHKVINFELRGYKERPGCLFNAKNIGAGMGFHNIEQDMLTLRGCSEGVEYTYLLLPPEESDSDSSELERRMYLSFVGIMVMIDRAKYVTREDFQEWFERYMPGQHIVDRLKMNPIALSQFSTLFAIKMGNVKDLRSLFNISDKYSDNAKVGILGCTKDMRRTYAEHVLKYSRFKGIKNELIWLGFIPERYVEEAEQGYRDFSQALPQCVIVDNVEGLIIHEPHIDIQIHADLFNNITNEINAKVDRRRRKIFKTRTTKEKDFLQDHSNIVALVQQLEEAVNAPIS